MNPDNLSFAAGDQIMYLNPWLSDDELTPVLIEKVLMFSLYRFPEHYAITAVVFDDETNGSAYCRYQLSHDHYEELDKFLTRHRYHLFSRSADPDRTVTVSVSQVIHYFKPVPMKIVHGNTIYMKTNGIFVFVYRVYNMPDLVHIRRIMGNLYKGDSLDEK